MRRNSNMEKVSELEKKSRNLIREIEIIKKSS
jgi:hypothetical protein